MRATTVGLSAKRERSQMICVTSHRVGNLPRCNALHANACHHKLQGAICTGALAVLVALTPAFEARAEVRLPPLDTDPQRCDRGYVRIDSSLSHRL